MTDEDAEALCRRQYGLRPKAVDHLTLPDIQPTASVHPRELLRWCEKEFDRACPEPTPPDLSGVRLDTPVPDLDALADRLQALLKAGSMTLDEFERGMDRLRTGWVRSPQVERRFM